MSKDEIIKELMSLPNIGKTLAAYIADCGIDSITTFRNSDPVVLWETLKSKHPDVRICKTHLKAIMAAQRGIPMSELKDK